MTTQEKGLKAMFDFIYILNPHALGEHPRSMKITDTLVIARSEATKQSPS
jgi:hypothetical protein